MSSAFQRVEDGADVFFRRLGTSCVIVINGAQAAYDLLEKKSAIYSGEWNTGLRRSTFRIPSPEAETSIPLSRPTENDCH